MKETMMLVTDLLDHNPGRSLMEIFYLSSNMPYQAIVNNLQRYGYGILVLPDNEVKRMAEDRLRRRMSDENANKFNIPQKEIQRACSPAYIEFLMGLENRAKEDKKRKEEAAVKAADAHAKKIEAAKHELEKAASEEEKARLAYEQSNINKQKKLQAYLDLLDERRNYQ